MARNVSASEISSESANRLLPAEAEALAEEAGHQEAHPARGLRIVPMSAATEFRLLNRKCGSSWPRSERSSASRASTRSSSARRSACTRAIECRRACSGRARRRAGRWRRRTAAASGHRRWRSSPASALRQVHAAATASRAPRRSRWRAITKPDAEPRAREPRAAECYPPAARARDTRTAATAARAAARAAAANITAHANGVALPTAITAASSSPNTSHSDRYSSSRSRLAMIGMHGVRARAPQSLMSMPPMKAKPRTMSVLRGRHRRAAGACRHTRP